MEARSQEARPPACERLRHAARAALGAALAAVDPERAVRRALAERPLPRGTRLLVLGLGKGSLPMLRGLLGVPDVTIDSGLVVTKDGHSEDVISLGGVRVAESAHPIPDTRAPQLAAEVLALARSAAASAAAGRPGPDLALVLLSGGGSALVAAPVPGVTLEDLAAVTRLLVRGGASISRINCVRKHLSLLHGGLLARAFGQLPSLTLAVSDVIGDEATAISSGPTVPDPTTFADALDVLDQHVPGRRTGVPRSVREHLEAGARGEHPETPGAADLDWSRHEFRIVTSLAVAAAAAREHLAGAGFEVHALPLDATDDPAVLAPALVTSLLATRSKGAGRVALVGGGEPTLVVTGTGRGGRNQHLASLVAAELARAQQAGWPGAAEAVVLVAATDGTDGPTEAAGGLVDAGTFERATRAGVEPAAALARFDSHALLLAAGDLLLTGPTGTNVMDLHVALA